MAELPADGPGEVPAVVRSRRGLTAHLREYGVVVGGRRLFLHSPGRVKLGQRWAPHLKAFVMPEHPEFDLSLELYAALLTWKKDFLAAHPDLPKREPESIDLVDEQDDGGSGSEEIDDQRGSTPKRHSNGKSPGTYKPKRSRVAEALEVPPPPPGPPPSYSSSSSSSAAAAAVDHGLSALAAAAALRAPSPLAAPAPLVPAVPAAPVAPPVQDAPAAPPAAPAAPAFPAAPAAPAAPPAAAAPAAPPVAPAAVDPPAPAPPAALAPVARPVRVVPAATAAPPVPPAALGVQRAPVVPGLAAPPGAPPGPRPDFDIEGYRVQNTTAIREVMRALSGKVDEERRFVDTYIAAVLNSNARLAADNARLVAETAALRAQVMEARAETMTIRTELFVRFGRQNEV